MQASYEDEEDAYKQNEEYEDTEKEMNDNPSSNYQYEEKTDDEHMDDYGRNENYYPSHHRAYAHERTGFQVDHRNYDRESDEYDAEMEDYIPPEPSNQQIGRHYDSENEYQQQNIQRHYDSKNDYHAQGSQRYYDSENDYPGHNVQRHYDSESDQQYPNIQRHYDSESDQQYQSSQRHYDSENDYHAQTTQRYYDSRSNSSATVERRYDSESEGGYMRDGYRYDSSEYPSTVEERYPSAKQKLNDDTIDYSARLAELEKTYNSRSNETYGNADEAATSAGMFSHDISNPRNRYLAEELHTPTPTEDLERTYPDEQEYDHYENEGYIDPVDTRQPSEYEPLSYNSRPPGSIPRRQSSSAGRFEEEIKAPEEVEGTNIQTKPLNGFLPNGYGQMSNNSIASSQGSGQNSVFQNVARKASDSSEHRPPSASGAIFEPMPNRRASDNQYTVTSTILEEPHDYEKEYAVYNNYPSTVEPGRDKAPDGFR